MKVTVFGKQADIGDSFPVYAEDRLEEVVDNYLDSGLQEVEDNPVMIAESTAEMDMLSVSGAVMRPDLLERLALVFVDAGNGRMDVIYRRRDGSIGWVDPEAENATA